MCGIIASIVKEDNSFFYCLSGLKQLQNRGYDSAGICSMTDKQFITTKFPKSPFSLISYTFCILANSRNRPK